MKNSITCPNCQAQNPFFQFNCRNCKSYLRERIPNIDIGTVLARVIDSPTEGFRLIIQSEHKNFLTWIILFASLKFFIDSIFISMIFDSNGAGLDWGITLPIITASVFLLVLSLAFLLKFIISKKGVDSRFKDNFAILFFSFIPHALASISIFPTELIVFGRELFSASPSPFDLNNSLAYSLLIFEILIILWGLFLSIMAVYTQTRSKVFSIFFGLLINILLFGLIIFLSTILY
jgi:hypothetical protein